MGNGLTRRLRRGKKSTRAAGETTPAEPDDQLAVTDADGRANEDGTAEGVAGADQAPGDIADEAIDAAEENRPAHAPAFLSREVPAAMAPAPGPGSRFGAWLGRPMTSFHLIIAVAGLLTTLGLIMVLSASGVRSYDADGSAWVIFGKQVMWTVVGLIACYAALRMSVRFLRRVAFTGYVVTVILLVLVLVPGIGNLANGSRKWFVIAGFSMQPSELAKIAFAIWGAHLLAARRLERASLRELLIPLVPAAVIALALIVAQPDLGQTVSFGIILLALLWYAGLPLRVFGTSLLAVFMAGGVLAMSAGYRSDRVRSWMNPENDPMDTGYQARQAKFALAHGGVFGDGLGQGVAKWNYLPNAHNDFIFAIIGEELGFIGAFGLLVLFGLFAYAGMRIARRSADPFLRLLTATTTMWVLGQAFINIGYVIGILPVTGIQLPLISAGGTSTAATLFMIGIMANAARHEPEAVAALRAGRDDKMNRILRLPLPEPYVPSRLEAFRDRRRVGTAPGKGGPRGNGKGGGKAKAPARKASRNSETPLRPAAARPSRQSGGSARSRVRHHGSGQRGVGTGLGKGAKGAGNAAGQRQPRRTRALEGQRYG
ncbi:putative lipid II flippase FtsW [Mycobacterium sp. 050134]|uniref:putative lipid II flippase FtsW n=1 Tax=Mycobacterium sp. 050134 TaxID=3096111 RepID=UPI003FA5C58E